MAEQVFKRFLGPMETSRKVEEVDTQLLQWMLHHRPQHEERKEGRFRLTKRSIKAGTDIVVVSMRNAIYMGQRPTSVSFPHDFVVQTLKQTNVGDWMNDDPQEVWQMRKPIEQARGKVLVGGLGLATISHLIGLCDGVRTVTTVERQAEVIILTGEALTSQPHHKIIQNNLFEYLQRLNRNGKFDYAFYDIWQPTGESVWWQYVVPLRRMSRRMVGWVECWNEDEMKGQLRQVLPRVAGTDASFKFSERAQGYYDVFRQVARSTVAGLETYTIDEAKANPMRTLEVGEANRKNESLEELLELYLAPSDPKWEATFGKLWDRLCTPHDARNGR